MSEPVKAEWPEVELAIAPDWWGPMHSTMVLAADEPVPDWTLGHERYIPASKLEQVAQELDDEIDTLDDLCRLYLAWKEDGAADGFAQASDRLQTLLKLLRDTTEGERGHLNG